MLANNQILYVKKINTKYVTITDIICKQTITAYSFIKLIFMIRMLEQQSNLINTDFLTLFNFFTLLFYLIQMRISVPIEHITVPSLPKSNTEDTITALFTILNLC